MEQTKKCTKCGEVKALGEFYRNKFHKNDGRSNRCAVCESFLKAKNHKANPSAAKAYQAQWREKNKEKCKAARRRYYIKNKEKLKEKSTVWGRENKEKVNARRREKDKENPEIERNRRLKKYWKNPEKARLAARKRHEDNREFNNSQQSKRREALPDHYVSTLIALNPKTPYGPGDEIPTDIIELKREQIKIKRTLTQLKKEIANA